LPDIEVVGDTSFMLRDHIFKKNQNCYYWNLLFIGKLLSQRFQQIKFETKLSIQVRFETIPVTGN
jgi:hypothetical protein